MNPKKLLTPFFVQTSFLFLAFQVLCCSMLLGQRNSSMKSEKVKVEDFAQESPLITDGTSAVILSDQGDVSFEGNRTGWFKYIFKRHKRILILKNTAQKLATVQLLLYKDGDSKESVESLSGSTYNLEDGLVTETKLNPKDVLEEKYDKNHFYRKFALPSVKAGSIVDYSYTVKSDFVFNMPSWEFQSTSGPTLWSEYKVDIPSLLGYMSVRQGYHKYSIDKASRSNKVYVVARVNDNGGALAQTNETLSVSAQTDQHTWVMKDVPALESENYLASPSNFIDKISFQLYQTYNGQEYHDVATNWKKVSEELMQRQEFGKPLMEDNYWLDKTLASVVSPNEAATEKAKKIYAYVQQVFKCTDKNDKYIQSSLQNVIKKQSGTVGEINLLLIAMLRHERLNADPVLLSTTEFGRNSPSYPLMEKLNYVICRIKIDSKDYFLDATVPFLPFGKLPLSCYNGHARVISADTTAVFFEPGSLKEEKILSAYVVNTDSAEIDGLFAQQMGFFESLNARTEIDKSDTLSFKEKIKRMYPDDMSISHLAIDSSKQVEAPLSLKFEFKLPAFGEAEIVYFNPILGGAIKENPFFASERVYPVEMPYTRNEVYTLNMEIPKGYKIEEIPKSSRVMLNGDEGSFEYLISAQNNYVQLRCNLVLNKATFDPIDYQTLRDFYAFVVKKEAEQIVFKKIK